MASVAKALDTNPTLQEAYSLLYRNRNEWNTIGEGLGVDVGFRQGLQAEGLMTSYGTKLEQVLQKWLESYCSPPTWRNLIETLKKPTVQMSNLAKDIEKSLGIADETTLHDSDPPASSLTLVQASSPVPDPPKVTPENCVPKHLIKIEEVDYSEELVKDINVIILTVTDDEYGAILAKTDEMKNKQDLKDVTENEVTFLIGKIGFYNVAIMQTESGQDEILKLLPKLLKLVPAKYIISVGMCYGMHENKNKFGDVIVSDTIMDFSNEHHGDESSMFKVKSHEVKGTILPVFRKADGFSLERFDDDDYVKVKVGTVIAKSTVVKAEDYKKNLQRQAPYALIGEMEGGAIVLATYHVDPRPEVIVIKGIADWGDRDKEKSRKWQKFASHAAASFVHFRMSKTKALLKKDINAAAKQ